MAEDRWLKIIDNNGTINVNDHISKFIFLEAKAEYPVSVENNITIKGADGELPGAVTFAPFNLVVKFGFDGIDGLDINLMERQLRSIFFKRKPYYILTSDNPSIKYKVNNPDINPDYSDFGTTKFEMTFSVKDGYSESLYSTNHIRTNDDTWQFGSGIQVDDDTLKYKHNSSGFKIFNGSDGKIDPLLRHNLIIYINIDAPNGFILWNRTTDEKFIYKGVVDSTQAFTLKGVHPLLNGQRVGHNSNWQWISLERGYNDFQFLGDGISNINIEFVFNYIYR